MNKLTGTATLEYLGTTKQVQVCLDLDENVLEVRHSMPDLMTTMSSLDRSNRHKSPAVLTDVRIPTPIGILAKDRLSDLFVTSHSPGSYSIYDATISRTLSLRGKEEGVMKIMLRPRNQRIEFIFHPFESLPPQFEIFYRCAKGSTLLPQELQLKPGRAVVGGENGGLVVRGDQPLTDREEFIRLSLGILLGGPITVHSILENDTLTVNFSSHDGGSLGPLYKKYEDAGVLLQGIYNFVAALPKSEWGKWSKGIYFFLQGIGGVGPLAVKAISLYTFLEIIDHTDTLDKKRISNLLGVTIDEADLICRTRNRLIHYGDDIGAAFLESVKSITRFKESLENKVFVNPPSEPHQTGVFFFLKLAMLLNRFWIQKAGFTGEWNDYSDYGIL